MRPYGWHPDRALNPQYADLPDVAWAGITVRCPHGEGGVTFNVPGHRLFQDGWNVIQKWPLTLNPSIHRLECGCHGHITNGRWVPV